MSLLLDMVVGKVKSASLQELTEFAEALATQLSEAQLAVIEHVLAREKERRVPARHTPVWPSPITPSPFPPRKTPWGI